MSFCLLSFHPGTCPVHLSVARCAVCPTPVCVARGAAAAVIQFFKKVESLIPSVVTASSQVHHLVPSLHHQLLVRITKLVSAANKAC